jgi:hypothetical protein
MSEDHRLMMMLLKEGYGKRFEELGFKIGNFSDGGWLEITKTLPTSWQETPEIHHTAYFEILIELQISPSDTNVIVTRVSFGFTQDGYKIELPKQSTTLIESADFIVTQSETNLNYLADSLMTKIDSWFEEVSSFIRGEQREWQVSLNAVSHCREKLTSLV